MLEQWVRGHRNTHGNAGEGTKATEWFKNRRNNPNQKIALYLHQWKRSKQTPEAAHQRAGSGAGFPSHTPCVSVTGALQTPTRAPGSVWARSRAHAAPLGWELGSREHAAGGWAAGGSPPSTSPAPVGWSGVPRAAALELCASGRGAVWNPAQCLPAPTPPPSVASPAAERSLVAGTGRSAGPRSLGRRASTRGSRRAEGSPASFGQRAPAAWVRDPHPRVSVCGGAPVPLAPRCWPPPAGHGSSGTAGRWTRRPGVTSPAPHSPQPRRSQPCRHCLCQPGKKACFRLCF